MEPRPASTDGVIAEAIFGTHRKDLSETPSDRQTVLFSATMPSRIDGIARRHLHDPVRIQIGRETPVRGGAPLVRQIAYVVPRSSKPAALGRVLDVESPAGAIVFCRTREEVDRVAEALNACGYRAGALHGGMGQEQRDRVMGRLRGGTADLLVATAGARTVGRWPRWSDETQPRETVPQGIVCRLDLVAAVPVQGLGG